MITKSNILEAHLRIQPNIHRTPILTSSSLNQITGCEMFFKCENFQKVGAFKIRGAMNAVLQLSSTEIEKGVVTHSSGNHAQSLALSAKKSGCKCYVIMPSNSPKVKVAAVKGYGANVTLCPPTLDNREKFTQEIINNTGATFIHPYNNEQVICGQATCAKEIFEEVKDIDIILAPVGGGGLLSGTILSTQFFSPNTKVIAAEPEGADDAYRSFKTGILVNSHSPTTIADGLLTTLGDLTWPIIKDGVENIFTVTDDEIKSALHLIFERLKIIVEPSSATVLAVILKNKKYFEGKRIAIILTGGNYEVK